VALRALGSEARRWKRQSLATTRSRGTERKKLAADDEARVAGDWHVEASTGS